jgi:hypothetical protein
MEIPDLATNASPSFWIVTFTLAKLQIFLLLFLQSGLPDLSQVTEANCYYGLGVALLKFESAVCQLEASIEAGQKVH